MIRMDRVEVAVIGAGPSGLCAALAAGQAGAQVTLIDAYGRPMAHILNRMSLAVRACFPLV